MAAHPNRTRWLRYLLSGTVLGLLLTVIFYQPIFFGLAHFIAQQVANSQNLTIEFKIHGSIFTNLTLEDIEVRPKPGNTVFPIEQLVVKRIAAHYNLGRIFQNRIADIVDVVLVRDVELVIRPVSPKTRKPPQLVRFPLVLPYKTDIQNFNFTLRLPTGNLDIRNTGLSFRRKETGVLSCAHLNIPNFGSWDNLRAFISESNNTLRITDLQLLPYVSINELRADLSQSAKGAGAINLDGTLLQGTLRLDGAIAQEQAANQLRAPFSLKVQATGVDLAALQKLLPERLEGELPSILVQVSGDAYRPSEWSGTAQATVQQVRFDKYTIDGARFETELAQGKSRSLELAVQMGKNLVHASGSFALPTDWTRLPTEIRAELGLACWLPEPQTFAPQIETAALITGSAAIDKGSLTGRFNLNAEPLKAAGCVVEEPEAQGYVAGSLPIGENWADSIAAVLIARTSTIHYQDIRVPEVRVDAELTNAASLEATTQVLAAPSSIKISASVPIPKPRTALDLRTIGGRLAVDIHSLNDFLSEPNVLGAFSVGGVVTVQNLEPDGKITCQGSSVNYRGLTAQNVNLELNFARDHVEIDKGTIDLDAFNSINIGGAIDLADPFRYHLDSKIAFQDLRSFNPFLSNYIAGSDLAGKFALNLEVDGTAKNVPSSAQLAITGDQIGFRGLTIQQLAVGASSANNDVNLSVLKILFDPKNHIDMSGAGKITSKFPYSGRADVELENLGFLNPPLRAFHQDLGLGGKLTINWGGTGELATANSNASLQNGASEQPAPEQNATNPSNGHLELRGTEITVKQFEHINAEVSGTYQALDGNLPTIKVSSPLGSLAMSLHVNPKILEMTGLIVKTHKHQLTGTATLPLDFQSGSKIPIAIGQPISIDLRTDKVNLADFQTGKPVVDGIGQLTVQANGDTSNPKVAVNIDASDLRSAAASTFAAASLQIAVNLENKNLTLNGTIKQPDIQPLAIAGKLAFDLPQIIKTGTLDENTPIQATVKWPDTSLSFLRRMIPEIRSIEGRAGVSVDVAGTLAKPSLRGELHTNIAQARARTDLVPPVSNFVAQINFRENRVDFAQLQGEAAGGPFNVSGSIDLSKGTDPKFAIGVHGTQILLTRSDNIIVRSNLDLTIKGPLSAGEVDGRVEITNSRFFQDIDILPLNLPGQPAPQPPKAPPNVSVDTPPFNNWKFNIAVVTKDPFKIQSNLARGSVVINIQVGGTGQRPSVTGYAKIENLTASLPFSHMDINDSYVNFNSGQNPLDPELNIIGRSTVRDYDITMHIYGRVSNFKVLFDSSPPLTQGDIATLLATGATSSEFVQDPSLLAGRAAFLVIRQLYSKIFKGGA
ncbi:MAG: translocation/assembly module TamB domain-containing protein, partial [Verrucomicrobia bacterium]|nr:translocation/assembly module TamB domain-containing protein [Verrucomicrobiota bacterium]